MPPTTISRDLEVSLADRRLRYQFHRVPRRRHIHLLVDDDGALHVRAPYRCSAFEAERLIRDNKIWVLRNLASAKHRLAERPLLRTGTSLPLLDERLELVVNRVQQMDLFERSGRGGAGEIHRHGGELRVRLEPFDEQCLKACLERWYREQAKCVLPGRLEHFAQTLSLWPKRVTVRGQKTCWGSCSGHGNISLNWRLMLLPQVLTDYVLIHELCHLRFLDHSRSFWRLVATLVPDFQLKRRTLRAVQSTLAF